MFKNYAIQTRMVKTNVSDSAEPQSMKIEVPTEEIIHISRSVIKNTAIAVVAVIGAAALAHTLSEVVIQNTTPHN
jgi:hypothetical protein